jgi:hypothetical protein
VLCTSEHPAAKLTTIGFEKCPVKAAWFIGCDVAEQRNHAGRMSAVEFEPWMKSQHLAAQLIRRHQLAAAEVGVNDGSARIARLIPNTQCKRDARCHIVRFGWI